MSDEFKAVTQDSSLLIGAPTSRRQQAENRTPTSEEIASFLAHFLPGKDAFLRQALASDICEMITRSQQPEASVPMEIIPGGESGWPVQQRY